jgi:DNA-directed RNA polymerase specialized sigma24 family protein
VTELSDLARLVERAKACNHESWEVLYRRMYPQLRAYASRRLDADRATGAVAETMARAVAGIHDVEPAGFQGWLFGILRRVVANTGAVANRGSLEAVHDEQAERLRAAFTALDAADQEVVELRAMAGLSPEAVAAALGAGRRTVRMAQARALQRLEQLAAHTTGQHATQSPS